MKVDFSGRRALHFVDFSVLALTAGAALFAGFDWNLPGRTLCAAVLVVFSPGWTVLRLIRAPIELFTFLLAAALSVAYTMLVTLVLTTRLGWEWQACAVVTAVGCVCGLAVVLVRRGTVEIEANPGTGVDARGWTVPTPKQFVRVAAERFMYGAAGLVIAVVGMLNTDIDAIGSWGMIQAVPPYFFLGTALIVVGVLHNLRGTRRSVAAAWAHIVALVIAFHGVVAFTEPNPRFPVAWLHVAFADHLADGGPLLQNVDARFSWPGFFTAAGYLERLAGTDTMLWALALAPVVITIVSAAVVYDLGLTLGLGRVRSTVAGLIFVLTNWIGQDYFAPQAMGFLLVFVIVDLVLRNLAIAPLAIRRLSLWVGTATQTPRRQFGNGSRALTSSIVLALSAAVIISHQLSPVMLICILGGLALVQRASTYRLTIIIGLAFLGWVSYAAEAYWLGNSNVLFGTVGDVSTIASKNVGERSAGAGDVRQLVFRLRMLTILTTWLVAAACLIASRRRNQLDRAFVVLLLAPFIPLLVQPYGGEGLLRTALFTLPGAAMLIASADLSRVTASRPARHTIAIGLTVLAAMLLPLLMVTRYGNESYEIVTDDDLAVNEAMGEILDQRDPRNAAQVKVFAFLRPSPVLIGRMEYYSSTRRLPRVPERAAGALQEQIDDGNEVFIVVTGPSLVQLEEVEGRQRGWEDEFFAELGRLIPLRVLATTEDGRVIQVGDQRP
jgi:hypothetical protein